MSDTEYLDLDAVAPVVKKVIKIAGAEYPYQTPTVADFAREMKRAKELRDRFKGKKIPEDEEIEITMGIMIDSVRSAFPTMPEEVLSSLKMEQLAAIKKFMDAEIKAESADAEDASGNG